MLRLVFRPLLVLILVFAGCVGTVRCVYGLLYDPTAPFIHAACDAPCWRGIDVATATYDDVAGALGVDEFPVYQRYYHSADDHDVVVLYREALKHIEVQRMACPVGLFTQLGGPDFVTYFRSGTYEQVATYFLHEVGSYAVVWESDAGFTLHQSPGDPIFGTLRTNPISWQRALMYLRPHCSG